MTSLRARLDGGPVSVRVGVVVLLALVAGIAAVVIGDRQQHSRKIPAVQSVEICRELTAGGSHCARFGAAQAAELAQIINRLPRHPSYGGGPAGPADWYRVTFASHGQELESGVAVSESSGVDVSSGGRAWGLDKWDPDGVMHDAIVRDLRSAGVQP